MNRQRAGHGFRLDRMVSVRKRNRRHHHRRQTPVGSRIRQMWMEMAE